MKLGGHIICHISKGINPSWLYGKGGDKMEGTRADSPLASVVSVKSITVAIDIETMQQKHMRRNHHVKLSKRCPVQSAFYIRPMIWGKKRNEICLHNKLRLSYGLLPT